jgi:hypothetical protein
MPAKHLNLSTIVDKNKIASEETFVILLELVVRDFAEDEVATIRFTKNSENITYMGNVYTAANFTIDIKTEAGKEPEMTLQAQDQTRMLAQYVDAYDGLIKSDCKLIVVNSGALTSPPELEETFKVVGGSIDGYVVNLQLGVESAVAQRFPPYRQFKERCVWKYKGVRCKYAGGMSSCDYTRDGPNGCIAHSNEINFGGFPGLNDLF